VYKTPTTCKPVFRSLRFGAAEVHLNMLSTFVFPLLLLVPDAVAIRRSKEEPVQPLRLRQGHASDKQKLADRQNDRSNLTPTVPIPGLQVYEHSSGSAKGQPSLVHVADAERRSTRWVPFSVQKSNAVGVWAQPGPVNNVHPGVRYPFESLTTNVSNTTDNSTSNISANKPFEKLESLEHLLGEKPSNEIIIVSLAGGTGASIGGTGSARVDRDLLRRMHYQDKAVMFLVLVVYLVALAFSFNLTYRHSCNNSPVTYYADPRFHNLAMQGHDLDAFLDTFNQPPKNISLRVAGFVPVSSEPSVGSIVQWHGENFQTAFSFSLDLTPWMAQESQIVDGTGRLTHTRSLHDAVLPEDRSSLNYVLTSDTNDLGYVQIVKHVKWSDWEELATNIKHQIRQSGFTGVISVDRGHSEELQVYKNKPWANFMHARATRVLCALSIFGWLIYLPYMWLRCKSTVVRSYYRVDVGISEYWPLIAEQLTGDGFEEFRPVPIVSNVPTVSSA